MYTHRTQKVSLKHPLIFVSIKLSSIFCVNCNNLINFFVCQENEILKLDCISKIKHFILFSILIVITQEQFWDVILRQKIPVTTCLVAFMGLPSTGKTTAIEGMLKKFIKLKEKSTYNFDDYMERKRNDQCLSIYELCVLGGLPHDKYAWSFATNRYGAINSIICSLARQYPSITEAVFESPKKKPKSFIDQHVQWLMAEVSTHLGKIKGETSKLTLIQDGISLINVMDVGVNKAIYDFLSIILLSCKKHFRVAFFSLDRDAPNLKEVPDLSHSHYEKNNDGKIVMRERSRLSYLLHFGTLGYKKDNPDAIDACNTVMVATKETSIHSDAVAVPEKDVLTEAKRAILKEAKKEGVDQFLKEWELVDLSDTDTLKSLGKTLQNIIKKVDQYKLELPLRWIILRSLVSSLNPQSANKPNSKAIIMTKDFIAREAVHLKMDRKDVEDFLIAFTEFCSILYMPQFEDIKHLVIVDIYGFTELLHKLFYPPNPEAPDAKRLLKYGIISLQSIRSLLGNDVVSNLMKILTSFVMVAEIKSEKSILIDEVLPHGVYYYLPSAKSGENYTPSEKDDKCAFLEVASVNFPANFQACISQGIMKENDDVLLCAIEYSNISQFEFKSREGAPVRIDLIYEGQKSRLVIRHDINASTFNSIVDACTKVLDAFCHCLGRKANTIRDLRHEVTIPCCHECKRHTLYCNKELEICTCLEEIDQNSFKSCWVAAAKKVDIL